MGKLYYCDYCDRSFVDDLQARKKHLQSSAHVRNRKLHYVSCRDLKTLVQEESRKEECFKFKNSGQCPFGENCYRSHFSRQQLDVFRKQILAKSQVLRNVLQLRTVESWLEKRSTVLPREQSSNVQQTYVSFHVLQQPGIRRDLPVSLQPINLCDVKDSEVADWG